eukprot:tig00000821_g4481.t1
MSAFYGAQLRSVASAFDSAVRRRRERGECARLQAAPAAHLPVTKELLEAEARDEEDKKALFQFGLEKGLLRPEHEEIWQTLTSNKGKKMFEALEQRTRHVVTLVENPNNPTINCAGMIRTCDALGLQEFHIVQPKLLMKRRKYRRTAFVQIEDLTDDISFGRVTKGAHQWLDIPFHGTVAEAAGQLHGRGYRIVAAAVDPEARPLSELAGFERPTAFFFGNESKGLTPEALALCDEKFYIPQFGFVESMNVSVACGIALAHGQTEARRAAGDAYFLSHDDKAALMDEWLRRLWAKRTTRGMRHAHAAAAAAAEAAGAAAAEEEEEELELELEAQS